MKKLICIVLFGHLFTSYVEAQNLNTHDNFQTLEEWYHQGENVTWGEIKGSYTGRSLFKHTPNSWQPSILTHISISHGGPGFPEQIIFSPMYKFSRSDYEYYDNITPKNLQSLKTSLHEYKHSFYNFRENPTVAIDVDIDLNDAPTDVMSIKRYGDYLILRSVNARTMYRNGHLYKKGETWFIAYYFKKVGP